MKKFAYSQAFTLLAFVLFFAVMAPRAAAQEGSISGQILDVVAKPWADVPVEIVSDQGTKTDTKTDKNGKYVFNNLRPGEYTLSLNLPGQKEPYVAGKVKVGGGQTVPVDLNFKDIVGKQGAQYEEAKKKQEEEKQKFQGMKQHFDAGVAALDQARQAKADMMKAPADQRESLKANVTTLNEKAVSELEAAKSASNEKDPNLQLILARLGDSYDAAGRTDDAIAAYKRAIEIKPTASYYNNLGGILGRAGKIDEATVAFQKCADLDPPNAAQAWLNYGIVLSNVSRYKEAMEPLKKATELDPKNAKAWYLLASAMVSDPSIYKQTGGKIEVTPLPGTVEAYQKAIELDSNGPWGQQAKQGLEQLNQMTGGGISTQVGGGKKKKP
ncbi:MAG TPA: tetratricopeptide repeat protein [Candidatus Acidoferrum sp.]|jgi:tetratricopeptide (TPR) repeat protein